VSGANSFEKAQMNVLLMLQLYRANAAPFVAENIKLFKQLSPADQSELLFYMIMDHASSANKEPNDEREH
jgi:hypothetical protein